MALLDEVKKTLKDKFGDCRENWLSDDDTKAKSFYLEDYLENLFEVPAYSISKLEEKRISALNSSAALAFNLFGDSSICYKNDMYQMAKHLLGVYNLVSDKDEKCKD